MNKLMYVLSNVHQTSKACIYLIKTHSYKNEKRKKHTILLFLKTTKVGVCMNSIEDA